MEVADIEFDLLFGIIFNGKVVPLEMAPSIGIYPHEEIILRGPHLNDYIKIASLKVGVKDNLFVDIESRVHTFEESGAFGLKVGVKLPEECSQVGIVGRVKVRVTEIVVVLQLLVHFETTPRAIAYFVCYLPM